MQSAAIRTSRAQASKPEASSTSAMPQRLPLSIANSNGPTSAKVSGGLQAWEAATRGLTGPALFQVLPL